MSASFVQSSSRARPRSKCTCDAILERSHTNARPVGGASQCKGTCRNTSASTWG
ncbi:hypothetical protein LEMLEM_LOCUS22448 [Lemmus lemmus]